MVDNRAGSTHPADQTTSRHHGDQASTSNPGHSIDPPAAVIRRTCVVDAVLAGDREAYRRLVERELAALVRACHRILGDHPEAEDAAQEAFVTAIVPLLSWRGEGPSGRG